MLATGQNTAPFCGTWCRPGSAASSECHPSVQANTCRPLTTDHTCARVAANGANFLREDPDRVANGDGLNSIVVPRGQLSASSNKTRQGADPARTPSVQSRPLTLAL